MEDILDMLKHVPNILTTIRFFLIPVIFYFAMQNNYIVAIVFLIISGITDVLDGYIARRFNYITKFGTLFDPFVDKLTQISTLLVLVIQNIIPVWILIIVIIKEVTMIICASFLFKKQNLAIPSRWYGKMTTVVFYIAIFSSMIIRQFNIPYSIDIYLYYIALALAVFSLIKYFQVFIDVKNKE